MSCSGLCRCFSLTRANRVVTINAVGRQRGIRCLAASLTLQRNYYVERAPYPYNRFNNPSVLNRNNRIIYACSSSAIFGNNGYHGNSTEDWLSVANIRTAGTKINSCTTLPWLSSGGESPVGISVRWLHTSPIQQKELAEAETKLESTVKHLKERKKEEEKAAVTKQTVESPEVAAPPPSSQEVVLPKKTILQRVKDEVLHYWHGFRLLGLDIKVAAKLLWRVLNGKTLTRREYRQFTRTAADLFRLLPFSVFIIIPFMEFLLPVAVKLFPSMLPSTFEDRSKKEEKLRKELKLKLEMAKFLQDSIEDTALVSKTSKEAKRAQEFATFIEKIRTSGEQASNEEIAKFSKLFENELTLDNLSREQLIAVCRLLRLKPFGTNNFLRFQLRMQLRNLMLDDKMIDKEGVDSLTEAELQAACQARGMRAIGVPVQRLKSQLQQWLDLHLDEQIPTSLLLLSRALYLPEHLPVTDQLKVTIASLPEKTASEAKIKLSELAGEKVSNTDRLNVIKEEEKVIHKEREERRQEEKEDLEKKRMEEAVAGLDREVIAEKMEEAQAKIAEEIAAAKEILIDTAPIVKQEPVIMQYAKKPEIVEDVSKEDIKELSEVIGQIAEEKDALLKEREKMEELKEDIEEYQEDLEDLRKEAEVFKDASHMQESKSSTLLSKRVGHLMSRIENIVDELEKEKGILQKTEESLTEDLRISQEGLMEDRDHGEEKKMEENIVNVRKDIISVEELMDSIHKFTKVTDEVKLRHIIEEMDVNEDGNVDIGEVIKALETISKERIALNTKQIGDIMDILSKEEEIEELEKEVKDIKEELKNGQLPPEGKEPPITPPPPPAAPESKKTEEMKQ